MDNFKRPYYSRSLDTLATWFKDYLYIAPGGNRCTKWKCYHNIFITFLISGLYMFFYGVEGAGVGSDTKLAGNSGILGAVDVAYLVLQLKRLRLSLASGGRINVIAAVFVK